jgi:two-component system invasion response regulator UvrY
MIKILLVDDHQLVRAGLRSILDNAGDMSVVGEAGDGDEALSIARTVDFDVVLMDIHMPDGMGGIEATRRLLRQAPAARIIALSQMSDDPLPAQLQQAGAIGYLTKGCPAKEMLDAIRAVHRGMPYIDAQLAQRRMVKTWRGTASTPFEQLSPREMQVTLMILDGRRNKDVAGSLSLSEKTVSTYRQRIYEKLGVGTDVELTRLAFRHGIITEGE